MSAPKFKVLKHVTLTKDFRCSSVVTMRCNLPSGVTRTQATVFSIATFQVVRHYDYDTHVLPEQVLFGVATLLCVRTIFNNILESVGFN